MTHRPNILFFFTDDQRFDTIAALGNHHIRTPNMDALVARGTTFTRAHIPGGTCGAVCCPSRAMVHSGRTLFHLDDCGQEIPEDHALLGETLRASGYQCHGIGKWHNGRRAFTRSFDGGASIFFGGMADHWNVPVYDFDPAGAYDGRCAYSVDAWRSSEIGFRQCDHIHAGVHSTDLLCGSAVDFLRGRDADRPFFLSVSLLAPHDPRTMPERFRVQYDPATMPLPENFLAQHPIDTGALRIRDEMLAAFPREPTEIRRHLAEYHAMIAHIDHELGRVLGVLEETGAAGDTVIVFAGDNGLAVGQHGLMGKQSCYEHSVRVPLIFAGPDIAVDERNDDLVYLLDIFPTLCDLAGIETPATVEGRSLAPRLRESVAVGRDHLYLVYADGVRAVSDGRRKLIRYRGGERQFFDLVADPLEMSDRSRRGECAAELAALDRVLTGCRDDWGDRNHRVGTAFWESLAVVQGGA